MKEDLMQKQVSKYSKYLVAGFAILLPAGLALAAGSKSERGNEVSKDAAKFLKKAAQGGMMEVRLGQLAEEKASSTKVKEFGQRMVKDHSAANDALKELASKKDVEIPKQLQGEHEDAVDRLSKLSGKEFDREYMKEMVQDHKKDVQEFKEEAKQAKDPDVKAFAAKHAPILEKHLDIAQSLAREVGPIGQQQSSR